MSTEIHAGSRVASGGFTLIELLVVMGIAVLLISLSGIAFTQVATGSRLNRAGQMIEDQIALAQQEALTNNRKIEVRFLDIDGKQQWRGIQILRFEENGSLTVISKIAVLPDATGLSPDSASSAQSLSPLLTSSNALTGTTTTPAYGSVAYRAFCFLPDGSLAGAVGSGNYVTYQNAGSPGSPPANYYTVQVNPITGKVTSYRP